ncbi:MAG: helix-turn-helix domain-containing protein, partial [Bdellovibrionales bacterium]
ISYLRLFNLQERHPVLASLTFPLELGNIPLAYLYILSATSVDFELRKVSRWHLLPLLIGAVFPFIPPLPMEALIFLFLSTVFTGFYTMLAHRRIAKFQLEAKNFTADLSDLHLPWLKFLLAMFYLVLLNRIYFLITGPDVHVQLYTGLIFSAAVMGLTYFALKNSNLFSTKLKPASKVSIPDDELERLKNKMLDLLEQDSLYLQPKLRLSEFADLMGVKSYKLSEIINRGLNTTFYDLINGMRVKHAQGMLNDPKFAHLNLMGIAMESGFNSKSVFNDAFRRIVGATPSEYRADGASRPN